MSTYYVPGTWLNFFNLYLINPPKKSYEVGINDPINEKIEI